MKNIFTIILFVVIGWAGYALATHRPTSKSFFSEPGASTNSASFFDKQEVRLFHPQSTQEFSFDTVRCQYNVVSFYGPATADSWFWDFGDNTVTNDTANIRNPRYAYQNTGIFTVTLRTVTAGDTLVETATIEIKAAPEVDLGPNDTVKCEDQPIFLDAGAGAGLTYRWSTGDTTQVLRVDSAGCYSVTVTNPVTGCSNSDRIFVTICGQERREAATWYFGNGAGLKFEGGDPTPLTDGAHNAAEGVSVISDFLGRLLFYTDGQNVYTKEHGPMLNGTGLNGAQDKAQGALIVPQPADCKNCPALYYVFTVGADNALYYTLVDMSSPAGDSLGAVVDTVKNVKLFDNSSERITSIENPRDSTFWIVGQNASGEFVVYHLTDEGLQVGSAQTFNLGTGVGEGYMKASADGKYLAVTVSSPVNGVEILQFNDSLGTITRFQPPLILDVGRPAPPAAYGVEFASDNETVYVSLSGDSSFIYQFNISNPDPDSILASRYLIDSTSQRVGALQRGPNGRIYVAIQGSTQLGVINNPSGVGAAADYQAATVDLGGKTSGLGLPNFTNTFLQPPSGPGFSVEGFCLGDSTSFSTGQICPPKEDTYFWTFGDGGTSTEQMPKHIYQSIGTYTVTLIRTNECKSDTAEQQITIVEPPKPVTIDMEGNECTGPMTLTARGNESTAGVGYFWLPTNDSTQSITVSQPGTYTVFAYTAMGECVESATVTVQFNADSSQFPRDTSVCTGETITLDAGNPGATYVWNTGQTTRTIQVSPEVEGINEYTVRITPSDTTCQTFTGTFRVTVNPLPDTSGYTVTPAQSCANNTNETGGSIRRADDPAGFTYAWTGPGGFTATTKDIEGLQPGVYSVTIADSIGCPVTRSFAVNATESTLSFTAQITDANCTTNTGSITLTNTSTGETGPLTYTWTRREDNQTVVSASENLADAQPGFYNVEIRQTNAPNCSFSLANLEIKEPEDKPLLTVNQTPLSCDTILLEAFSATASGNQNPDVSFEWRAETNAGPVLPHESGRIKVTVQGSYYVKAFNTNDPACFTDSIISVTFPAAPQVNIVSDAPACTGEVVTLTARITDATPGEYRFAWARGGTLITGARDSILRVSEPGTYTVTVTNANGCTGTATEEVTFNVAPEITVTPSSDTICAGSSIQLTASEMPSTSPYTYRWSDGSSGRVINVTPQTSAIYTVTVISSNGCEATASANITVVPLPLVTIAQGDTAICAGDSITLSVSSPSTEGTYTWSTGQTGPTVSVRPTATTNYSVTFVNANGCSASDTVAVAVNPAPVANIIQNDTAICAGTTIVLEAAVASGASYAWSTGDTTRQISVTPDATTTYRLTVSSNGCSREDSVRVTVNPIPEVAIAQGDTAICAGSAITLSIVSPRTDGTYTWSTNQTGPQITVSPTTSTAYSVRFVTNEGCSNADTVQVDVNPVPVANIIQNDTTICSGTTINLEVAEVPGATYLWSNGNTLPQVSVAPEETTSYWVRVTQNGCSSSDTIRVTVNPTPAITIVQGDTTICVSRNGTVRESANLEVTQQEGVTYRWTNDQNTSVQSGAAIVVSPNVTTIYTVVATRANCTDTATVTVSVRPYPEVDLGDNRMACPGEQVVLDASNPNNPADVVYAWTFNGRPLQAVTPTLTVDSAGTYAVVVSNGRCSSSSAVNVGFHPAPDSSAAERNFTVCVDDNEQVEIGVERTAGYTYRWRHLPGAAGATNKITVNSPGDYILQVINSFGCSREETFTVTEACEPRVFVPEAFSPNGDGNNDTFRAFGAHLNNFELIIFNRWGEVIFASTDPELAWDGTYRGQPVPVGSYVWTLSYSSEFYPDRQAVRMRGALLLLR